MKRLAVLLLLCLLSACTTLQDKATTSAANDLISTAAGLAVGATEANPLGVVLIPAKVGVLAYTSGLPTGERETVQAAVTAIWTGAAANNWCVVVAIATGGVLAPACIVIGTVVAWQLWTGSEMERQFWALCARDRQAIPELKCLYTTPGNKSG